MYVQVKDSQVPKREVNSSVARNNESIIIILDDKHVEAIGLTVFLTEEEAFNMASDLLAFVQSGKAVIA